ncbi:DUF192 domain-containing protein [Clostridium sp. DL1XJH146]
MLSLKNKTNGTIVVSNVVEANTFFKRLKGLMFTKELSPQTAMYIHPCNGVHTYFMNYAIDVLYLDINNQIISIDKNMKPYKLGKPHQNAVAVIELSNGMIEKSQLRIGQVLELI